MKNILITGSSGYIATNFIQQFADKYNFILLSHNKKLGHITFDELYVNSKLINSIDVVINLAGTNIADKKWSQSRKNQLLNSRILTTQKIVALFNQLNKKPHLISASAIGIYDENLISDESTSINYQKYANFSQEITKKWELTATQYTGAVTIARFGVVLGGFGGSFPKMLQPFLFYAGGVLSTGTQRMPWIALPDLLNALDYVISNQLTGIYNLVAPHMVNNRELSNCIAQTWHKPVLFRIPACAIKILFGQMGQELFLSNLQVVPTRLIESKFVFKYPNLSEALTAIKNRFF